MWEISVNSQIFTCLYSVALGVLLAFIYDIISAVVKAMSGARIVLFIGDIFFWIISAFSVFIFLLSRTNGEIRGYVIFFAGCGFVFYRVTLHKLVFPATCYLLSLFMLVYRKTVYALSRVCDLLERIFGKIGAKIGKTALNILFKAKKVLKSVFSMLYTDKNQKKAE